MRLSTQTALGLNAFSLVMDVGVLMLTPAHEVDFANPLVCELFGCGEPQELERLWPDLLPRFVPVLAEAVRRDQPIPLDFDLPGGATARRLSCQVHRLQEDECDAFLILLRDRDVLDSLRTDLILASQLRGLALLYRAITHDLRAPLHSMALNLEVLRRSLDGAGEIEPEERNRQVEVLDVLHEELERLNRSLQNLLAETAPSGAPAAEVDARELLQEIERLLRPQARMQGVVLSLEVGDAPLPLLGQRDRLKQALLNVAINALEAMTAGGELALAGRRDDGTIELALRDTGPGIPARVRRRIFDLHFTTKASGTGIGLYVARSIVESHGGTLVVESEVGAGSTFCFRLPALAKGEE